MFYYLHLPVPEPLRGQVAGWRQKYEGEVRSVPHLTVVVPRAARPNLEEKDLAAACRSAAAKLLPVEIKTQGLAYFGDFQVIHVAVERTPELALIHTSLNEAVIPYLSPASTPYTTMRNPHITIANRQTPHRGRIIWQELQNNQSELVTRPWTASTVNLLAREPQDKQWHLVESFSLRE